MADFTVEELNVLYEALDAWKDKDGVSDFLDLMIPALTARSRQEAEKNMEDHERRQFAAKQARAAAKANRKERAIILQAKILEMRRLLEAQTD